MRASEVLPIDKSTSGSFAVVIKGLLGRVGIRSPDVDIVAVDVGPGSFTGLRIAVTFAKTFAYATGADMVGISVMDVLAEQATANLASRSGRLWTLLDAHRGQLFAARYMTTLEGGARLSRETQMIDIDPWLEQLEPTDMITGPIVERLLPRLPAGVSVVDAELRMPSARTVARLAWKRWQQGKRDDLWTLAPNYHRKSAAEERLETAGP